jgi:hypothetical protein
MRRRSPKKVKKDVRLLDTSGKTRKGKRQAGKKR